MNLKLTLAVIGLTTGARVMAQDASAGGNWRFSQRTDPLTSETSSWFTLQSSPEWETGGLSVRCNSGRIKETSILSKGMVWERPLASDQAGLIGTLSSKDGVHGKNTFRVRLDEQKPFEAKWFVEEDFQTFRVERKDYEKILRASKIVVQYAGRNRNVTSLVFDAQGLDRALFSKTCGAAYSALPAAGN
jgi:hypothetical protein